MSKFCKNSRHMYTYPFIAFMLPAVKRTSTGRHIIVHIHSFIVLCYATSGQKNIIIHIHSFIVSCYATSGQKNINEQTWYYYTKTFFHYRLCYQWAKEHQQADIIIIIHIKTKVENIQSTTKEFCVFYCKMIIIHIHSFLVSCCVTSGQKNINK